MGMSEKINRDLARNCLIAGLIVLVLTLIMMVTKTITGYESVSFENTYDDCRITTWTRTSHVGRRRHTYFYVRVEQKVYETGEYDFNTMQGDTDGEFSTEDINVDETGEYYTIFQRSVPRRYYRLFTDYSGTKVTMYKNSDGYKFPVHSNNINTRQAEVDYRRLNPPYLWYFAYSAGAFIGLLLLSIAYKAKKTADNYRDGNIYEYPEHLFTKEDAFEAMAHMRMQREKDMSKDRNNFNNRNNRRF